MIKRLIIFLILAFSFSLTAHADDQPAQQIGQSENAAKKDTFSVTPVVNPEVVANFPLDETFMNKMAALHQQLPSLPQEPNDPKIGNDTSISGLISTIQYKPKLMKLLADNGLTAQDYVVGSMALAAALAAASAEGEDQIFDETNAVSTANLEFAKKHIDEIRIILEE